MYQILRHDSTALRGPSERMVHTMAIDYASIGLRIKHARNKKNMTQEQLADVLGMSREHLSRAEAGDRGVSLEMLIAISNALNAPISELLADNLISSEVTTDTDLHYILLDCTHQEEKIITKVAQALKAILLENGI